MAVGFRADEVRQSRNATRVSRSRAPGEAGHSQIEAAPEEVNGTDLAEERGPEALQHAIDRHTSTEEACHRIRIVGPRGVIVDKGDRVGHLVRAAVEVRRRPELAQQIGEARVEVRHRHWGEFEADYPPAALRPDHCVVEEIEHDFDASRPIGHERRREAARIDVKGRVPGVVDPGGAGEPVLAHDLDVEAKGRAGIAPGLVRNVGPRICDAHGFCHYIGLRRSTILVSASRQRPPQPCAVGPYRPTPQAC
jgi:hypothetical protein